MILAIKLHKYGNKQFGYLKSIPVCIRAGDYESGTSRKFKKIEFFTYFVM